MRKQAGLMRIVLLTAVLGLCGCATPPAPPPVQPPIAGARELTARMLSPLTPPRDALRLRQQLRKSGDAAIPYLGETFFPIGLYDVPEGALHETASAGFNLIVNGAKDPAYLRRAEALGLKVIPYVNTDDLAESVRRVQNERAILAWYLWDEPDLNGVAPARYRDLAESLRRADPTRPIFLTVWRPERYGDYVGASDILAPNPYPIRRADPAHNDLLTVARTLDAAKAAAGDRPVWAILQAFWADPWWVRAPTPEEMRAMVFLALNHGADGILYFSYRCGNAPLAQYSALFGEITAINGRLRALQGPLLIAPEILAVRDDLIGAALRATGIDASIRRFGDAALLIAVNPFHQARECALDFSFLAPAARRLELFIPGETSPSPITPGQPVTLRFHPFEVRVFWLD